MNMQLISNLKRIAARLSAVLVLTLLLLPACARQPRPAGVEEIIFQSGEFTLVGDLRTPAGTGPFPVVLFVHGSGDADRTMFGMYLPIMERMLRAGYAVFSWDKPGYGESTGQLRDAQSFYVDPTARLRKYFMPPRAPIRSSRTAPVCGVARLYRVNQAIARDFCVN